MLETRTLLPHINPMIEKHRLNAAYVVAVQDGDTVDAVELQHTSNIPEVQEKLQDTILEEAVSILRKRNAHNLADQLSEVM